MGFFLKAESDYFLFFFVSRRIKRINQESLMEYKRWWSDLNKFQIKQERRVEEEIFLFFIFSDLFGI